MCQSFVLITEVVGLPNFPTGTFNKLGLTSKIRKMEIQRLDENGKVRQEFYEHALKCCNEGIEIWCQVENYQGIYEISNMGNIRSVFRLVKHGRYGLVKTKGKLLRGGIDTAGYRRLNLIKDGKYTTKSIHKLVGIHFIPNPCNKPEINHKYGIKLNCTVVDLEWTTRIENIEHAWKTGLSKPHIMKKGKDSPLSHQIVRYDMYGNYVGEFGSAREASSVTGIDRKDIYNCVKQKNRFAGGFHWRYK